jgi:riboflavin kinase/FMN adenylyltransferase
MQHFWSLEELWLGTSWLTIGAFDGVHRGHQQIIQQLTAGAHAAGVPAVVLTFYPHPSAVLGKRDGPFYLTTPEQRAHLLGQLGVDFVISHPFNRQVANTSAQDFMAYLVAHIHPQQLCVGYDFALGRGREGNVERLSELGQEFDYGVHVFAPVKLGGEVVSSSQIRAELTQGNVSRAAELLGRPYSVSGVVVQGDGRGHSIGVPTANLDVWKKLVLPKPGVYACQARLQARTYAAVTNIGYRPTFPGAPPSPQVEAHLLDFHQNVYGKQIELFFYERLRDEQKFPSVDALVAQIQSDIQRGREILQSVASPP